MKDDNGGMMAFYGLISLANHIGLKPEEFARIFFKKPSKEYLDAFTKAGTAFVLEELSKKFNK